MNTGKSQEPSGAISALASLLAVLVFVIVYAVVGVIAELWDFLRGLDDDPLQILLRIVVAPAAGGYAGIAAAAALPRVRVRWTFYIVCALAGAVALGLFLRLYLVHGSLGTSLQETVFLLITLLAAIAGAGTGLWQRR